MHAISSWKSRKQRSVKSKTVKTNRLPADQPSSDCSPKPVLSEGRQSYRRCNNRTSRRKRWLSPSACLSSNCYVKPWSLKDCLRSWKDSSKFRCRYFYGSGCGQVLLERDIEEGIWKVMTVPGCRFSPLWLDTILEWATQYRAALLDLNKESDSHDSSENKEPPSVSEDGRDYNVREGEICRSAVDVSDKNGSSCAIGSRVKLLINGKACISLRCERMGLTDVELDMISKWQKQNSSVLGIAKLWLFDNKITDCGARHIAQLINDELLEIHVSHNSMTNTGARQIMAAAASTRKATSKPFWLRMEWNMINYDELKTFISEMEKEKGIVVDIPRFHLRRSRGKASSCLINERKMAHLRLPWIQCQRLRPSEAPVLMQAKSSWQENHNNTTQDVSPSPAPATKRLSESPQGLNLKSVQPISDEVGSSGPLLVFPDTSALLGLIGCKVKAGNTHFLSFEWLESLCQKGHFGRSIAANERVFFVLCDSVMKQLDGLKKHSAHVGLCVRKLVNSGLEKYGPAGQDFLTILGAHEGEGIIVDRNAEVLDSRSHHVFNKGQAIDLKIVEVALFFQQELCQAANHFRAAANEKDPVGQRPNPNNPFCFPVVLFSNDNVQLMAAKSHGLPAFRCTDLHKCIQSKEVMNGKRPLTASALRSLIGKKATGGLGARARKSLQDEFDGIVACMKHLMESYEDARNLLGQTKEILQGNSEDALIQLKQLLAVDQSDPSSERRKQNKTSIKAADSESIMNENTSDETEEDSVFRIILDDGTNPTTNEADDSKTTESSYANSSNADDDEGFDVETIPLVRAKLAEWEGLVKSYQHPSRILRWTSGQLYSD